MNKDKNEYFEETMLEYFVGGILSCARRFWKWIELDVVIPILIFLIPIVVVIMLLSALPSGAEQRQEALDTYYECRNVQGLSEEACLLLALDID